MDGRVTTALQGGPLPNAARILGKCSQKCIENVRLIWPLWRAIPEGVKGGKERGVPGYGARVLAI